MTELTDTAKDLLRRRYLKRNDKGEVIETPEQMFQRVAKAVTEGYFIGLPQDEQRYILQYQKFYSLISSLKFLPNSPTLMNAGTGSKSLSACFLIPIEDNMKSIFRALSDASTVWQGGGGTGFTFSRLREKGAIVKSSGGTSTGPISFMKVFDQAAEAVKQGGRRRSANMGIMTINSPDIEEFIKCKNIDGVLRNFNITVTVTDRFMEAVKNNGLFSLVSPHTGNTTKIVRARELFRDLAYQSYSTGEPGIAFIDTINKYNPTPELGDIEYCNPCVTKDTLIGVADGRNAVSIGQLTEEGKDVLVFCYDTNKNKVTKRLARNFRKTANNEEVYKVVLTDNNYIIATKNHKFMLKDKSKVELFELKPGTLLMECGRKEKAEVKSIYYYGHEDVYNCTVDEFHNYMIVTDNAMNVFREDPVSLGLRKVEVTKEQQLKFMSGVISENCGEFFGLDGESCNLGSINLLAHVNNKEIFWQLLGGTVETAVEFLDSIIDLNNFPLDYIKEATLRTRKIGLGIMGWADALCEMGIPYDSPQAIELAEQVMKFISDKAKTTSSSLDKLGKAKRNPNKQLTIIAPTGSISMIVNCSSGIEPLFALAYKKNVINDQGYIMINPVFEKALKERGLYNNEILDEISSSLSIQNSQRIPQDLRKVFLTAHDINPRAHLLMQATFQKYVDSGVSKTCNLPNCATVEDIENIYMTAWELGCKGVTVYRDGCRAGQVIQVAKPQEPKTITKDIPDHIEGITHKITTGCGTMRVIVNTDDNMPSEIFVQIGKAGGCMCATGEAMARLTSLGLRSGISVEKIIEQLKDIRCPNPSLSKDGTIYSCPDAIAKVLGHYTGRGSVIREVMSDKKVSIANIGLNPECPECGARLVFTEGCQKCPSCDWARCG